ncbi:hypothetical protein B4O97_17300 [Marispirochaeta aestuarii]|uniref:Tripartite ATP-independent periplasmic transporters DctQ component domain-containing protein n=1 Tax=Marispirochaeta aestuarii TaxID=1963862 RepID=A0A1Y1RV18_9SPIO|nr:TRAP transporter small permease [Marispirochaeta aestuarii]ORC31168.1 hypothetical protein B4O97_17300 [Marispirochaeta aestuarii]
MFFGRFQAALEKAYSMFLILLTLTMFIIVAFNVFMRFVMNQSLGWADELARFIFIWIGFLGAVLAYKNDEHVGLSFLIDAIQSSRGKRIISVIQQILSLVVLLFITYFGYQASTTVMNVSPALSIPMSLMYLIVPFCGGMMCLLGIGKLIAIFRGAEIQTNIRNSVE